MERVEKALRPPLIKDSLLFLRPPKMELKLWQMSVRRLRLKTA